MAVTSKELRSTGRLPSGRPITVIPRVGLNSAMYLVTGLLALLAIYAVMGNVVGWGQERIDDLRYGATRTFHTRAVVGHDDSAAMPTHFIAMNLNRQVVILEIPGGDSAKTRVITGPYLFGAGEDKTPILLAFSDVTDDGMPDMIVNIKNEAIVYVNRDGQFQPVSPEERAMLMAHR
ncbi:MAG: hypothetical protein HXY39_20390 [Chloroflexi bacterium]|nr:hypothetical protein [Chloroflexota bacterium]